MDIHFLRKDRYKTKLLQYFILRPDKRGQLQRPEYS